MAVLCAQALGQQRALWCRVGTPHNTHALGRDNAPPPPHTHTKHTHPHTHTHTHPHTHTQHTSKALGPGHARTVGAQDDVLCDQALGQHGPLGQVVSAQVHVAQERLQRRLGGPVRVARATRGV
jgi:hypothetical protein